MTTVVLGANGVVGSRIAVRLAKEGEDVVGVGRGVQRVEAKIRYHQLDLAHQTNELAQLITDLRPRGVINAAAMTNVDACESNRDEAWTLNVDVVRIAARAANATGARLTHLSTDYVFDGVKGSYSEGDLTNPGSFYGITKRDGENAALVAGDSAVCRVAVVYSGFRDVKATFAVTVVESLRAGRIVKAFTDQIVSPTLADNAAEMVIGVHRSGKQDVFHCAGATEISRIDFCRAIARKLGADEALIVPIQLADLRLPAFRPLRCGLKVDKVKRLLGEAMPLPLDAALDRFLAERAG